MLPLIKIGFCSTYEQISLNEGTEYVRSITAIDAKNTKDVKSVYQTFSTVGGITTDFSADTVLESVSPRNFKITDKITISPTGIASCAGQTFSGISTNSIIRYQRDGFTTETFARVSAVSTDLQFLTLTGVATVTGALRIPDGAKNGNRISVGDSEDLKIYHNGGHNYIDSVNGNLTIRGANDENAILYTANGSIELFHDSVKRFETSSVGVSIPQDLDVDGCLLYTSPSPRDS
mgnify:CR=1 FL=1